MKPVKPETAEAPPAEQTGMRDGLAAIGQRAFSEADVSAFMTEAAATVARILNVQYCSVLEFIKDTGTFRLFAGFSWAGNPHEGAIVDGGPKSQAGFTLTSSLPVIVEDYKKEPRFTVPSVVHKTAVKSGLSVAIPARDGPFGVLSVATTGARAFSEGDVTFLQGVAHAFAVAVERRRAMDSLQDTSQRLEMLVGASPLAIVEVDTEGNIRSWNATAERLFGWSLDEVVGLPDPLLFQSTQEEVHELLQRVLQGETLTKIATQVAQKEGPLVNVTVSAAPTFDQTGSISGMLVLIADMTEQRQTEAARAQLTELIETTTDFVTITDLPGRGFYINGAGRRMLGISPEEDISALTLETIFAGDAQSFIANDVMPAAVRDGGWNGEVMLFSRNGKQIPVSMVMIAHTGPDGHVEFYSLIARDISERKRFEQQLVQLANHDPLTGLYTRRRFQEEVDRHLAEARRYGVHGALVFVDLDQFKDVNDSLGHPAGDALLVRVSALLRERLRETDIIARMGGDEFAVLLAHTDRTQALALTERLLDSLRKTTIEAEGRPINVTASIGIALFPEHATTLDDLLARADLAMYQSKENGRNQFSLYAPDRDLQADSQSRLSWQRRIREALDRDLFQLQAQPILDLRTNRIAQYELLVRMIGDKGEIIHPGAFLDTAERFGLIQAIDRWVIRRAIRLLAGHHGAGRDIKLAVNVSGKALADADLLPMIQDELTRAGVNPRSLSLEITETTAITNIHLAEKFVDTLRNLGCQVGLDDFGVGFASFYHLKSLAVDYLKIDGSFIRDLPRNTVDQHLVKAIVAIARGLGKATIAEFVSDDETLKLLREYGVDCAQGFHIGADAGPEIVSLGPEAAAPPKRR